MHIEPTETEIAWAAGLFEGEGCFNAFKRKSGKWGVQVRLGMTDREPVERFARIVGAGAVHDGRQAQKHENWKPLHEWYVQSGPEVARVIDMLMPHLCKRRAGKAQEVRDIAATIRPHNGTRTHCPRGHELAGDNLDANSLRAGKRACRTCRNAQSRERARKRLGITPDRFRVSE